MRFYFIILTLGFFLASPQGAFAYSPPLLSLHQIIAKADLIARGKIIKKEPIKITFKGLTKTCGWEIHFDILESIRGEDNKVIFFINSDKLLTSLDQEYLVVAYKTDKIDDENTCFFPFENFNKQLATDNGEQENEQQLNISDLPVTKISEYTYRVYDWEGVFPIDQYSSIKLGDAWLMYLDRMSNVRISYKPLDLEIRQVPEGENIEHPATYKIIRYKDFIQKLVVELPD